MTIERIADEKGNPLAPTPWAPEEDDNTRLELTGLTLPAEKDPLPIRLKAKFDQAGTFRVSIRADLPQDEQKDDAVLDDNVAVHELSVRDQSIRVLYVDRLPRYDWRFLSNYLTREASPDLIRARAPGAAGRSTAEHSRFLTHVLLQTMDPTVDPPYTRGPGMKPLKSFPTTRDQLFSYDVVILGDVDRKLLGRTAQEESQILALLRDFVAEGGGLALQPGVDLKNPLDFIGTPLAELLPVAVSEEDRRLTERVNHEFRLELTDAGARHPIFHVVPTPEGDEIQAITSVWRGDDRSISSEWKWWWTYRPRGGIKPGAVDLARAFVDDPAVRDDFVDERDRPIVVFAAMSFGKGRVFWAGLDDISRIRREHRDQIYGAFWEQVIRYLATYRLLGGNKRFKIFTDEERYQVGDRAVVTITALNPRFEPLDDPFLDGVHVELPDNRGRLDLDGDQRPKGASSEGGPPGTYRFELPIKHTGTYLIWIEQREDARDVGDRAEKRIKAENRAREDALRVPNHEVLAEVAKATDGRVVSLADLEDLTIPSHTITRVLDRKQRPQWDKAWVLVLITLLLGLEWALRKHWQMI
jgi:hypothetical protein